MSILTELDQLRLRAADGVVHPNAVVAFARNPDTDLHSSFNWDNDSAADAYRLWQARQIIAVHVRLMDRGDGQLLDVKAFVSIDEDPGYQDTRVVLHNPTKRQALILAVLKRIASTLALHPLPEFDEVRQAIERTRMQYGVSDFKQPPSRKKEGRGRGKH